MDLMTFVRNQWDRVAAWVLVILGALFVLLGWLGVSDAVLTTEQLPYIISGGLGGVCCIGVGVALWLSADLRDEWTALREIAERLEIDVEPAIRTEAADDPTPARNGRLVARPARKAVSTK
jgi:hypothetical protein